MSARVVHRLLGAAGVAAITLAVAPVVAQPAYAATVFEPDFANSYFWAGGVVSTFPDVAAVPDQSVQTGEKIYVAFTRPIKLAQQTLTSTNTAPASFLQSVSNPSAQPISGSTTVDGSSNNVLVFSPSSAVPDGQYKLSVGVFDANNCPDYNPLAVPPMNPNPDCAGYDGFVKDGSSPFVWRYDTTGPAPTVGAVNDGNPIYAGGIKNVAFQGTTDGDTRVISVSLKGPGVVGTWLVDGHAAMTSFVDDAHTRTWSASADLSDLPNGTYTAVATGADLAGNKTTTPGTQTFTIKAHPTAPRNLKVRAGDASAVASWSPPAATGGSPITAYEIVADDTTTMSDTPALSLLYCNGTDCPKSGKVTGLVNGHRYQVSVFAITDVGNGDRASVAATPKWRTTLTVLGKKRLQKGSSMGLTGRLSHTSDGSAVKNATVVVTPHYDNGSVGDSFKVTTDTFGTWYHRVAPTKDVTYVAHFAGDAKDRPASGHRHVDVYVMRLSSTG